MFDTRRQTVFNKVDRSDGPVVYVMSRELRVSDNWGLLFAQRTALEHKAQLYVVFEVLDSTKPNFSNHLRNVYSALNHIGQRLHDLNIHFKILDRRTQSLEDFLTTIHASYVYLDFSPLRGPQTRTTKLSQLPSTVIEVDSHNIVPARYVSSKQEYSAHTFRTKYLKVLPEFLTPIPQVVKHPYNTYVIVQPSTSAQIDLELNEQTAKERLASFIQTKLPTYAKDKNNPTISGTSNLSAFLHFGMISAHCIYQEVHNATADKESKDAFLEQLTVRKELSDNYCLYNSMYDSPLGLPDWGIKTLTKHLSDQREFIYTLEEFEAGKTHDTLWNACQKQLVETGYMHGYLRMYWAKKILEWTADFTQAHAIAVYLNDKHQLDGRDPNGYVGIAWSIGGLHDRPWFEKPIFGLIRTMTRSGMERKFDVDSYIKTQALS